MRYGVIFAVLVLAGPAVAAGDEEGMLNPDELSLDYFARKSEQGFVDPMGSMHGYMAAKSGDYATARRILERQAAQGVTQAMTWMGWMEDNGLGAPEDPDKAAEWDRRAAEAGDHVGMFNYGLDLLRGRGVRQDEAAGRAMIDRAAAAGDETARGLIADGYDLETVTPDADNWKYDRQIY